MLFSGIRAGADPPGALLSQKVIVPASMRTDVFATDRYLNIPPGFRISVWARLNGARFLAAAPNGDIFVAQPSAGRIVILRPDPAGGAPAQLVYASGLRSPQGLAFDNVNGATWLYVGETNQIDRYPWNSGDSVAPRGQVIVAGLPDGGGYAHPLKDVAAGPDHRVYVGIGSSCNACAEDTTASPVRASIYRYNPDGSAGQIFARGLRNPEGLAFLPGTNTLWAAVNNRDEIVYPLRDATGNYGKLVRSYVDDHPPDLLTAVREGGNYGWPFCDSTQDAAGGYDNMALNADFELNQDGHVDCSAMDRATKGIQAHSAPLGMMFLQGTKFAAPYRNGAAIAYHGSWDRSTPTGYKVVYFPWNSGSQTPAEPVDLISGFEGWGRPVAVAVASDGSLLITDDASGTIYKLEWAPSAVSAANGYPIIAPNSYAAVYGAFPAPLTGVSLTMTDSKGQSFAVPLTYVSPSQINFIVPGGVAAGTASLTMKAQAVSMNLGAPEILPTAPALFSLSGDGNGIAAATAADGMGNPIPLFSCSPVGCSEVPVSTANGPVYLSFYGTGIRGAAQGGVQLSINGVTVPVLYAGAQPTYPGLDQINVRLPSSLAGSGEVPIQVTTSDGKSNAVLISIQ